MSELDPSTLITISIEVAEMMIKDNVYDSTLRFLLELKQYIDLDSIEKNSKVKYLSLLFKCFIKLLDNYNAKIILNEIEKTGNNEVMQKLESEYKSIQFLQGDF
jgi:hypothetical protein